MSKIHLQKSHAQNPNKNNGHLRNYYESKAYTRNIHANKAKSFAAGALILTAAGLVARLFGFVFRICLSNLVGAEGMGLYELVAPVYTAIVLTLTSGITIAVSKMVAEQEARLNRDYSAKITLWALVMVVAAGVAVSVLLMLNPGAISSRVLGDARTSGALMAIAFCLPAVVAGAALKGYFYGAQRVTPAAVSQVAEQAVKIGILFFMAESIAERGAGFACTIATLAAALGEIANCAILAAVFVSAEKYSFTFKRMRNYLQSAYAAIVQKPASAAKSDLRGAFSKRQAIRMTHGQKMHRPKMPEQKPPGQMHPGQKSFGKALNGAAGRQSGDRTAAALLKTALPVSVNRLVVSALSAAEYILIPVMLAAGGLDDKSSMEEFGRLTGMALPLIMFPSLATNSLATTLVPAISGAASMKNWKTANRQASRSIQLTFILGVIFSALFFCYPDEIGSIVYKREKIGDLLFMLSFSCPLVYLQQTLAGVMNGLGRQGVLLRNTVVGSALRIGAIYFLVPVHGIRGYIAGFAASLAAAEFLNLSAIHKTTGIVIDLRNWILKPCIAGIAAVLLGGYIRRFFGMLRLNDTIAVLMALLANVLVSVLLMIAGGVLKPGEMLKMTGLRLMQRDKAQMR